MEDALQDAFERALHNWSGGSPRNPRGWLYTVAKNRILDALHSRKRLGEELPETAASDSRISDLEEGRTLDDQLRLICLCCHPSLATRPQTLLTLKLVAGLTVNEIAAAFVMKPKTVGQALTRAKTKIRLAGIPYDIPDEGHLKGRLGTVRNVLYLTFNEGYHSNSDHSLYRVDLCREAIRLARLLTAIYPGDTESVGLLALMLYQHARSPARSTSDGRPVLLEHQNRGLWNMPMIQEADGHYRRLASKRIDHSEGWYILHAAIAREHARAETFSATDWWRICTLYSELYIRKPDPVVLLAWIGAESYRTSPEAALDLMEVHHLEAHLTGYRWFYSTRAELRRRAGRSLQARSDFEKALTMTPNPGERRYLEDRIANLD